MATFKAEVQNKRADGTYNVRIRVIHESQVRRISTNIYASPEDVTKSLKIKNQSILTDTDSIIRVCRSVCNDLGFTINGMDIDLLVDLLKKKLTGGDKFKLDVFRYTKEKIKEMSPGTAINYNCMLNCLQRFIKRDNLDILEINTAFLEQFKRFILSEPSQVGSNRKKDKKKLPAKGTRAVSLYLGLLRSIHNKAKKEYNQEDIGVIAIQFSPFEYFQIGKQPPTRKRALSIEDIQKIINLPYEKEIIGGRWSRFNMAKDCFLLSFGLIGMNSADFYHSNPKKKNIITYNRKKTATRRDDKAEMKVRIESCIEPLLKKYRDPEGDRLFSFYKHYATHQALNSAINKGLKQIGTKLELEDLEFYAARHSWATIARSKAVGIDKATVHEALNHVDEEMKVTDIYIDRDWSVIWDANRKVLEKFDWTAVSNCS